MSVDHAGDPTARCAQDSGISGIQVFLDDPDQGGTAIGQATVSTTAGASANQFGLTDGRAPAFGD